MSTKPTNALTDLFATLAVVAGVTFVIAAYAIGTEGIDKILTLVFGK